MGLRAKMIMQYIRIAFLVKLHSLFGTFSVSYQRPVPRIRNQELKKEFPFGGFRVDKAFVTMNHSN